ncbi:MAG: ABC transporter permease [Elusimicrobia bacterium]|nr:ABC transporter permease [Elusimicrobiota bacterium]
MRRAPGWLKAYCGGIYTFLYLPMGVMMAFSFNSAHRNVAWAGFTFRWYVKLFHDAQWAQALGTSLELAVSAAVISAALGLLASYAMARHSDFRGKRAYASLLNVPMMMPEVILGVGLLTFFVRAHLRLSFWTLVVSHVVFCLPYATGTIRARLMSLKQSSFEEAAMDLGATEWQAFKRVTFPLAWPAIFSGAVLAFTVSFEDFVTTFFVAGIGTVTMPIKIYSMMKFGITPEVNALATLLLLLTAAGLLAHYLLAGER